MKRKADTVFWREKLLERGLSSRSQILSVGDTFVSEITKQFFPVSQGKILEGGCGMGVHVAALVRAGFDCLGVDNSKEICKQAAKELPELDIRCDDVRCLSFASQEFDGYWSVGVIEHFYEGYEQVVLEAHRVLKEKGIFFLVFPMYSLLRRIKNMFHMYAAMDGLVEVDKFYQFLFSPNEVERVLLRNNFVKVARVYKKGFSGLQKDVPVLKKCWRFFSSFMSQNMRWYVRRLMDLIFDRFSGHICILVFKKV